MSEGDPGQRDDSHPLASGSAAVASAGGLLKAAREAQGLHIAALAVSLKVPVKKLEALEADRFDLLPDIVFVRALAASICRTLKVDPVQVLANLPNHTEVQLNPKVPVMSVPFRASHDRVGLSLGGQLSKPLIYAVSLLIVGVMVLVFVPVSQLAELGNFTKSSTKVSAAASDSRSTSESPTVTSVPSSLGPSSSLQEPQAVRTPAIVVPTAAVLPLAGAEVEPSNSAQEKLGPSVVFTARGTSWVEVIDATAAVKLRKTLASGEIASATGVAPLSIVVGRADLVDVQSRGKSFDLMPVTKDNVARFEVK